MELATGEKLEGPLITIGLARKEGWFNKTGSKWHTMPEQMLRYRAAAWFVNVYAPEIAMGLRTAEEEQDAVDYVQQADGSFAPAAEEAAPTITTADIAAQVEQQQLAEEPMQQEAAPAPQPEATADREAEKKAKEAELENLRAETEQLCRDVGMNDRDFWDAVGRTRNNWTTSDCKRLRKRAEARQKQMAQSAAAPGAGESMAQEESLPPVESVPCPRTGERVAETVCNACNQRNGCPEWEA